MSEFWIYHLSLTSGNILLLAFSIVAFFSIKPQGEAYSGYNNTQRILGCTLFVWACYISIHNIFSLRFTNNYLAETISLSTYLFLMNGFDMALHSLLDKNYNLLKHTKRAIAECSIYSVALLFNYFFIPKQYHHISILLYAVPLLVKMYVATRSAHKRYIDVKNNLDNYYSDNTSESVTWIRNFIYIMLAMGFSCVILPYGNALSDAIMMFAGACIITYMMMSINNFFISTIMIKPLIIEMENNNSSAEVMSEFKHQQTKKALDIWVKKLKFIEPGITIEDVATDIHSNRTYKSEYLNQSLNLTFRNWISLLKIEHSKSLLLKHPDYTTMRIAEMVGYARSSYNKAFAKITGQSPTAYRQHPKS